MEALNAKSQRDSCGKAGPALTKMSNDSIHRGLLQIGQPRFYGRLGLQNLKRHRQVQTLRLGAIERVGIAGVGVAHDASRWVIP